MSKTSGMACFLIAAALTPVAHAGKSELGAINFPKTCADSPPLYTLKMARRRTVR